MSEEARCRNISSLKTRKISSGEIIDVASVLYAGATGNEAECLERPAQERVPVTGDANTESGTG